MPGRRTILAVAAATIALLLVHAAISGCDHDEVQHLHGAWLVSQGKVPFRDFLEQRHPVIYYALAPAIRAFEGSPRALIFAIRSLDLLLLVVGLAVFLRLVRPFVPDRDALWPVLLLLGCFFFARNSMEVRPDPWMSFFCLLALWQWASYLRGGKLWNAALAGLCIGIAIAILQKAFAFAGLLAIGTIPAALGGRERLVRATRGGGMAIAAALVPLAVLVLLVQRAGIWTDFVFWNYTFNGFYYLATQYEGPSAAAVVGISVAEHALLWIGGFAGLWLTFRRFRHLGDQPEIALSAAVVIGILASLFQSRWPFSHNLLLMQPALGVLAVAALEELRDPRWRAAAGVLLVLLVAKVGVMCFTYDEGHGNVAIEDRILALTEPTDPVAAAPPYHPIFRRDSFFFWYVPLNNAQAYLECCRRFGCPPGKVEHDLAAWRIDPPAVVYLPADEPSWAPVGFPAYRNQYRATDVAGLFVRRPPPDGGQAATNPQ
jgi:4-amino-4-deoxy-L-arabinose transferase-like glycosyltransferase